MPSKSVSDCAIKTDFNLKAGCLVDGVLGKFAIYLNISRMYFGAEKSAKKVVNFLPKNLEVN